MGEIVTLLNSANLSMHRMVFCTVVIISVARHALVSAYLEYYPAFRRSVEESPSLPETIWDRGFHRSVDEVLSPRDSSWDRDRTVDVNPPKHEREDGTFQSASKSEDEETTVQDTTTASDETLNTGNVADTKSEISYQTTTDEEPSVFKTILAPDNTDDLIFLAISAGFSMVALVSLISLFICWYKLHRNTKAAADVEYPAYGVTGPNKELSPTGDRRLAQSAQMYHYQHQKQQIIAMESSRANSERRGSVSEADSDEDNEEGDYTVYECPGLAAQTGEMEVKNPLFQDDPTPAAAVQNPVESAVNGDKK